MPQPKTEISLANQDQSLLTVSELLRADKEKELSLRKDFCVGLMHKVYAIFKHEIKDENEFNEDVESLMNLMATDYRSYSYKIIFDAILYGAHHSDDNRFTIRNACKWIDAAKEKQLQLFNKKKKLLQDKERKRIADEYKVKKLTYYNEIAEWYKVYIDNGSLLINAYQKKVRDYANYLIEDKLVNKVSLKDLEPYESDKKDKAEQWLKNDVEVRRMKGERIKHQSFVKPNTLEDTVKYFNALTFFELNFDAWIKEGLKPESISELTERINTKH